MPCDNIFYYAMCHNLGSSLIITMDDESQYFEKTKLCPKFFIVPHVRF